MPTYVAKLGAWEAAAAAAGSASSSRTSNCGAYQSVAFESAAIQPSFAKCESRSHSEKVSEPIHSTVYTRCALSAAHCSENAESSTNKILPAEKCTASQPCCFEPDLHSRRFGGKLSRYPHGLWRSRSCGSLSRANDGVQYRLVQHPCLSEFSEVNPEMVSAVPQVSRRRDNKPRNTKPFLLPYEEASMGGHISPISPPQVWARDTELQALGAELETIKGELAERAMFLSVLRRGRPISVEPSTQSQSAQIQKSGEIVHVKPVEWGKIETSQAQDHDANPAGYCEIKVMQLLREQADMLKEAVALLCEMEREGVALLLSVDSLTQRHAEAVDIKMQTTAALEEQRQLLERSRGCLVLEQEVNKQLR